MTIADFAHLRGRRVAILTPIYRDPSYEYERAIFATMAACQQFGIGFGIKQVHGDSLIARARNQLTAWFRSSPAQDAFFIDADMEWQPNDFLRLVASDQLVIGAPYRRRIMEIPESDPLSWTVRFLSDSQDGIREDKRQALEVEGVGTGFLRIRREVFEQLIAAHPDWKAPGSPLMTQQERDNYYRFFRFPESEDRGEDYFFCQEWRKLGGTIWVDPLTSIGHVGTHVYRGDFRKLLKRAK